MARKQAAKTFLNKVLGEDDVETLDEDFDLDDININEEQAIKGLESGLNSAIKKGVQKGAEESVLPTAQRVAKSVIDQVIGGRGNSALDDVLEKEKKITEIEMLRAAKDRFIPKQQPQQQQQSEPELLQTILLLKQQGFDSDEIMKYVRLMRGGSDPLMILELLGNTGNKGTAGHYAPPQDNTMMAMLPLLMGMNQNNNNQPPVQQNNGMGEVMAMFMQTMGTMQQQTMMLMQQMNQQSQEANERMLQFMAQAQDAKQENLMHSISPYLNRRDPDEELVDSMERFKKLKEIFAPSTEKYNMPVNRDLLEHEQVMVQLRHEQELDKLKMDREREKDEKDSILLDKITAIAEKGLNALKARETTDSQDSPAEDFASRMASLRNRIESENPNTVAESSSHRDPLMGVVQ